MQGMDGCLSLCVGGKLHEGTACSKRRRTGERRWVISEQAGPTGEGAGSTRWPGSLRHRQPESQTVGQQSQQPFAQTESWTMKDQMVKEAHSQPAIVLDSQPFGHPFNQTASLPDSSLSNTRSSTGHGLREHPPATDTRARVVIRCAELK